MGARHTASSWRRLHWELVHVAEGDSIGNWHMQLEETPFGTGTCSWRRLHWEQAHVAGVDSIGNWHMQLEETSLGTGTCSWRRLHWDQAHAASCCIYTLVYMHLHIHTPHYSSLTNVVHCLCSKHNLLYMLTISLVHIHAWIPFQWMLQLLF